MITMIVGLHGAHSGGLPLDIADVYDDVDRCAGQASPSPQLFCFRPHGKDEPRAELNELLSLLSYSPSESPTNTKRRRNWTDCCY